MSEFDSPSEIGLETESDWATAFEKQIATASAFEFVIGSASVSG